MPRSAAAIDPSDVSATSRLRADLAGRILKLLKDQGAQPGHRLVECDLCRHFGVSRTPIRGALQLLANAGTVESRANRGYVLLHPIREAPEPPTLTGQDEEDRELLVKIARARNNGLLPDECSQQEMVRHLDVTMATLLRVLRQLADLGLVERKPGKGWIFLPAIDSTRAQEESYAFRRVVEPAALLAPTFELDQNWLERSRAQHESFRKRRWRDTLAVEFFQMNADFHEQLARCSGNRYLLGAVQGQNRLRSFLNYHWVHGVPRVIASIEEHLAIMDALADGRNDRASALMLDHLASSSRTFSPMGAGMTPGRP
ncbi:FCD domain-containing protein [Gluconacetobacter sp. Hr-1-5]|uniref:GntR family transcriptional regulator n=1 Tax=Gluconacetobacter sp. Hr-1-5 TaxID=3395370 RepID=UPI003B522AA1